MYYLIQVLFSVVMTAFYIMMASKPREACSALTFSADNQPSQENVSGSLTASFVCGFILHIINFVVNTFVEPCIRLSSVDNEREPGQSRYSNWFIVGILVDSIFRLAFLTFSIGQLFLLGSDSVAKCSADVPSLGYDANWLRSLATMQLVFVPTFFFWRYFAKLDNVAAAESDGDALPGDDHPQTAGKQDPYLEQLRKEAKQIHQLKQQCYNELYRL